MMIPTKRNHGSAPAWLGFLMALVTSLACAQQPDTLLHTILPPQTGVQSGASLGYSVAVDGIYTVTGAPRDDTGALNSGAVKVFHSTTGALLHVIPNPVPSDGCWFGESVALSGNRLIVGAARDNTGASNSGRVYVYDLSGATPTTPVHTIINPGPAVGDMFGYSVAISGALVVVSAPNDDTGATDSGSVYVYDLSSGTPTVPVHTLNNPGPAASDWFGASVAISGSRVLVGTPFDDTGASNSGSAYVYNLSGGTPTVPTHTLGNPGPAANDQFGYAVSISGTSLVVGAYQDDTGASNAGSAYVYNLSSGTPTVPTHTLSNPGPAVDDFFGSSVAISGTRVVVGAYSDNTGAANAGSAYVYDVSSGTPTVPAVTLNNPSPAVDDYFGSAVALSGTRVLVGAKLDDLGANDAGSAYVYEVSSGTPSVPIATLNSPGTTPSGQFGSSIAMSGNLLVVGASGDDADGSNAGAAFVYDLNSGTPTAPLLVIGNPSPAVDDAFGASVAIDGTRVVVSAPGDDTGAANAGSVYVYNLSSVTPAVPVLVLNNPGPAANDAFGNSVAISGTRVLVGASGDDTGAVNAGSAYVYNVSSGTPSVPVLTLSNPAPAAQDQFGRAVVISGNRVAVAAREDDAGGTDAGSVYLYDLTGGSPSSPVHTLGNPNYAANINFGTGLALSGARLVVGNTRYGGLGGTGGAAFIYDLSGATPTVPAITLQKTGLTTVNRFGIAVTIDGLRTAVSDPLVAGGGAGDVSLYDLGGSVPASPVATIQNTFGGSSSSEFDEICSDFPPGECPFAGTGPFATALSMSGDKLALNRRDFSLDTGYVYVFGPGDVTTDTPILTAPSAGLATGSPIAVTFTLPETALAGSVKLAFGATPLTLASAVESAGTHSFSFNPANPAATPQIASGSPIADGSYTVTLSYKDSLGNPTASASSVNVTVDTTGPSGGNVTLSPVSPVPASSAVTVSFTSWTDGRTPLQYAVLINDVVVSAQGSSASRNLTAPATPGTYTLRGRIYDALGNLTETTQSFEVVLTPQQQFDAAMAAATLTGPDAQASATPRQDGVANLLKYAFNMNLTTPDRRTLLPGGGTAGLPVITLPSPGVMRMEYLRRIGSGLIYTPKKRNVLDTGAWTPLTSPAVLTPINANWERVRHDELFIPATVDGMFGCVEVTLP